MNVLICIIVCFIAGIGAGLGTGFAGMSAAAVISPMLITFLGMPAYEAVGIALASDVLASAVSAYTYGKNKNLDIKNGIVMLISVLVFTFVGSYDAVFRYQIYCAPGHDNKREHGGYQYTKAFGAVDNQWYYRWIYLRLCRCGRRYDDAAPFDQCTWI